MFQSDFSKPCLQEQFAPESVCFGCGPKNHEGLRLRSHAHETLLIALWYPNPVHQAFPGILSGGVISALLDCHQNWMALWFLKGLRETNERLPCTVTASLQIELLRPTSIEYPVFLKAWPVKQEGRKVWISATLESCEQVTARGSGCFVEVKVDHPAAKEWGKGRNCL